MRHALILVNTDYADTPYDEWARQAGVLPHLIVAREKAAGYAHVPDAVAFADYRTTGLVEKTALELGRRVELSAVIARTEADVLRAARIRQALGLQGQSKQSALAYRDKRVMKECFTRANIPIASYACVDSAIDVLGFIESVGYPVVVKPALGSGSVDTQLIRDEEGLEELLRKGVQERSLIERFVPGDMYHIDGLVSSSEVVVSIPSKYVNDCLSFQRGEFLGSYPIADDDPLRDRLNRVTASMIASLPAVAEMVFHAEIFHTPGDELIACEVASRTGGGRINQMLKIGHGIDLDREWFLRQLGAQDIRATAACAPVRGLAAEGKHVGQVLIYPPVGTITELPAGPRPSWVEQEKLVGQVGQRFEGGYKSGEVLAAYIVSDSSIAGLVQRFDEIVTWFGRGVQWSA